MKMSHQSYIRHCFPLALKPTKQTNLHQSSHVHLVLAVQDSSPTCDLESAKACKYTPVQPEMAKSVGSRTSFCSKCSLPEAQVALFVYAQVNLNEFQNVPNRCFQNCESTFRIRASASLSTAAMRRSSSGEEA